MRGAKWLKDWMRAIIGGYKIWIKERRLFFTKQAQSLIEWIANQLIVVFYLVVLLVMGYVIYKLALLIIRI